MLPAHMRLKRPRDFDAVRRQGKRWRNDHVIINAAPNQLPHNRFGFVVGKKLGKAVRRNKVKRQLREIVRARLSDLIPGYDVVIIALPPAAGADFRQLVESVEQLLKDARLWSEKTN